MNRDYDEYRKSQVRGQQCLQRQQHRISKPYSVVNKETSLPSSCSTSQSHSVDYTPATYHRRHHSHQFPISHPTNPNKTLINGTVIAKKEHPTESSAYCGRLSPSKRSKSIDFDAANFKTGIDSSRSRSLINVGRQFHPSYSQFTLPSESFHSKFHPFHRSLCLSQPAHETSAIRRQQRSTIELASFNGEDSRRDLKRLEELDKLIEVERLKRKLAKMSLRPHYQQSSSSRSQRSAAETISNWSVAEPSAGNASNLQRQSRRQLVRYPTLYGLPPSEVPDDRYKPDRPSVERSLSIVSNYSCANDASVKCHCGDEINSTRMSANGTNLFALSTANIRYIDDDDDVSSRNASMFAKRGRPNDHSSSSNTYSYHTPSPLNSSINSFDFIAAPYSYCGTAMCSQRDGSDGMHSVIDQPAIPTDTNDFMDNLRNTCLHQNHSHQSLLVPINEQFHSHPTMSGSTQNVYRADKKYKVDEGFRVTASSRGRLNARINRSLNRNHYCCGRFHPDISTEKRIISRSCDGLNMQQSSTGCCQFRFDRFPAMLHRCETETLNSIDECCANSPEFGSTSSTSNAKLSRIQSAFERVLKRATSSISNQPSRLTAPYLSMNNLIINENDTG
ncbi:unnamed protein product [Anisakis simplex]|uniref:Uncharacterized protein n=1 Tax=Anisakis simplex TaxID=6269 RepID=A0A3P6RSZ9_ANISI|nr:unnamed protein product [Anisakis simplex]